MNCGHNYFSDICDLGIHSLLVIINACKTTTQIHFCHAFCDQNCSCNEIKKKMDTFFHRCVSKKKCWEANQPITIQMDPEFCLKIDSIFS